MHAAAEEVAAGRLTEAGGRVTRCAVSIPRLFGSVHL